MMDWTDRHERAFLRLFTKHAFMYTEMLTSAALVHGDAPYLLAHKPLEHPVGVQLGGSNPVELAQAARLAESAGYREINLNIGCPSDRVQSGRFGACLMKEPSLVAECVSAIKRQVDLPVTIKCRIGVDDQDSEVQLCRFINEVATAGCSLFVIHARVAILKGLSPRENREVPPLKYDRVFAVKQRFPELDIIINGGIRDLTEASDMLQQVDGVMVGREAYQNPFTLRNVDEFFFGATPEIKTRLQYLSDYLPYVQEELRIGTPLHHMTRHILGLFKGEHGGRNFRRHLSEFSNQPNASINVLVDAMALVN